MVGKLPSASPGLCINCPDNIRLDANHRMLHSLSITFLKCHIMMLYAESARLTFIISIH